MKLVIDENIEFGVEAFSQFGEVKTSHGRKINNELLKDADALIVRSITKVNKELLDNTSVKFVGTTTIGTDHLDKDYLKEKGIVYSSAPGCNSFAVTEYVFTVISKIYSTLGKELNGKSIGIIGHGNIGTKVARFAKSLGLKTVINDPPLKDETKNDFYRSLDEALQCEIITFHVPLNKEGKYKTVHLLDEEKLKLIKPGTIVINSSRGSVVDNLALLKRIEEKNDLFVVLDVWENEPRLNKSLLEKVIFSTPHIAGYTLEGKINGTVMIYDALANFVGAEKFWKPSLPLIPNNILEPSHTNSNTSLLNSLLSQIYNIEDDTKILKNLSKLKTDELAAEFDKLRKNYNLRREFNNFSVKNDELNQEQINFLKELRFNII